MYRMINNGLVREVETELSKELLEAAGFRCDDAEIEVTAEQGAAILRDNLKTLTVEKLTQLCAEREIEVPTGAKKSALVELIVACDLPEA